MMSIVSTTQAAHLLGVTSARVRKLLLEGRIRGAYKIGKIWAIPLYKGMPVISKGNRGPLPQWKSRQGKCPTVIHVYKNQIGKKDDNGYYLPAILVKNVPEVDDYEAHEVYIYGPSKIVYRPDRPYSSGAKLWIETICDVKGYLREIMAEKN